MIKQNCTCTGACKGADGLGHNWACALRETKTYRDAQGNRVDLATLCAREPGWAANRISELMRQVEALLRGNDQMRLLAGLPLPPDIVTKLQEFERIQKLFDDAGQGEHNVLALVDHYQRENMLLQYSPTLHWSHGPKGWDSLVCQPEHPLSPVLTVTRRGYDARVKVTWCEVGTDDELTVADVVVPHRSDLFDCSICNGAGQVMSVTGTHECQWCRGLQRTAMDEGKEIACALYWSWLRSPNGGQRAAPPHQEGMKK